MPSENTRLVIYEKLYGFLQALNYSSAQDQAAVAKLLEMYQANPAKTLALLNTLLSSNVTGDSPDRLTPELELILKTEAVEIPMAFYAN